jgi:hypothetical protein
MKQSDGSAADPRAYQYQYLGTPNYRCEALTACKDFYWESNENLAFGRKMMLPMINEGLTINSCVNSGSEDSIIREDLVMQLHLEIDSALEHQNEFRMAKGNPVKALGQISINCAFGRDPSVESCCICYILE